MKKQINLYQPSCYPKREKATFKQFMIALLSCMLSVLVLCLILNKQFAAIEEQTEQQKALLATKRTELSDLVVQLQKKRAPQAKVRQQVALENEIKAKQRLLASLANIKVDKTLSFSQLMRGLSLANMDAVSIERFSIIEERLNISGQATQSDSVPLWLTKIQATEELSGIAFEKLQIADSDNFEGFAFQLTNSLKKKIDKVPSK